MATVRRWYVYLVCAVSLQSAVWAILGLVSALILLRGFEFLQSALPQIALLIVAVPVFAIHWVWAQRLAHRDVEERGSAVRQLYLYGTLAAFVAPAAVNGYNLLLTGLQLVMKDAIQSDVGGPTPSQTITRALVVLAGLGLFWLYHRQVIAGDGRTTPENDAQLTLRRLYVLGFSAAGATVTFLAAIHLLRWVLYQFGSSALTLHPGGPLSDTVAGMAIGLLLWLPYWAWAQRLFAGPDETERISALRKFYLYAFVFAGTAGAVGNATLILAGVLRSALGLPTAGDIRGPLPIIVGMGLMWAYHAYVLRGDGARLGEAPRQAGIRRLYQYLVAAVGLAALLIGLGGVITALIQALAASVFGNGPRELLAISAAALLAGLPVWFWPWRQTARAAGAAGATGGDERRSIVRRIYLYLFIFAATMTVLASAVYLVYRVLSQVFGLNAGGNLPVDLGKDIAYTLIGVAVWVYHGLLIRADGGRNRRERAGRLASLEVVVLDSGDEGFGKALVAGFEHDLPGLKASLFDARTLAADSVAWDPARAKLASAGLIVAGWNVPGLPAADGSSPIASALTASPAKKLLVPVRLKDWDWAAVERWSAAALISQTLQAVKQWADGEEVRLSRPPSLGAIVGWIAGILLLLEVGLAVAVAIYYASQYAR